MADREVRSPSMMSTVPPVEIIPEETPEEAARSERYETLLPGQEPHINSHTYMSHDMPDAPEDNNQHLLSLDFGAIQRDQYRTVFNDRKALIETFTKKVWPADSGLAQEARSFLQQLHCMVMHPDLDNADTISQSPVEASQQADWDMHSSTKFRFLKPLLETAKTYNLHVALLVEPGRLAAILQTFLQGIDIMYNVIDGENNVINESSTATILLTTIEGGVDIPSLDMIIVLDGNMPVDTVAKTQKMLSQDVLLPTISTVIPRSVEHAQRCLSKNLSEAERLHVLVSTLTGERHFAGWQTGGTENLEAKASDIISWVLNPGEDSPFHGLPDLQFVEVIHSQSDDEEVNSLKRPLESNGDDLPIQKKARVEESLPMTINPADMHLPHPDSVNLSRVHSQVSDSVAASQHAAAMQALKDEFARKEAKFHSAIQSAQLQTQQHAKAMESLQYEFEEQRAQLIKVQEERDQALLREMRHQERILNLQAKNTSIREELLVANNQLEVARTSLTSHNVPERAELEQVRLEAQLAKTKEEKASARSKALEQQLDYLREQYQTTSNQASSFATANAAQEKRIQELEIKASGEQARLRGMHFDTFNKKLQDQNRKLTATLTERNATMARMNEEVIRLREASRGRVGTRASSVPRTPRSRQGSPASTRPRHPLSKG